MLGVTVAGVHQDGRQAKTQDPGWGGNQVGKKMIPPIWLLSRGVEGTSGGAGAIIRKTRTIGGRRREKTDGAPVGRG